MLDPTRAATFNSTKILNDKSDNPDYEFLDLNNRAYGNCATCVNKFAFGVFNDPSLPESLQAMNRLTCFSGSGKRTLPFTVVGGNVSYDANAIRSSEQCSGIIMFVKGMQYTPMAKCMAFMTVTGRMPTAPIWSAPSCLPNATNQNSNSAVACGCSTVIAQEIATKVCAPDTFPDPCGGIDCIGTKICTPPSPAPTSTPPPTTCATSFSPNSQNVSGTCVCNAGYRYSPTSPAGSQCQPCAPGTLKQTAGNSIACDACTVPNGTYNITTASPAATSYSQCGTVNCTIGSYLAPAHACLAYCSTVSMEPTFANPAAAQTWCNNNCAANKPYCLGRITQCNESGTSKTSIQYPPCT
jgi:hypothetical protein